MCTKGETRRKLKLQKLQIKLSTQHFVPQDKGVLLIIPVGPCNGVNDLSGVPRWTKGELMSHKSGIKKYENVMYLAAVEQAVPWCTLTAEIMRACRYYHECCGPSVGRNFHMCFSVCVSITLEPLT